MSRLAKLAVLSCSVLVFSYVALGYVLGKTSDDAPYRSLSVFSEVLQHIQQDYVEDPNLPLVTSGALHGLLESLDPHSSYLSPREYAEYSRNSRNAPRGGTGATLSKRFGYIALVSALPDSPAQKGGLRHGDILEAIAGFTTREMSIGQAQRLLAGEPGTFVKVTVVRRGRADPQEVELVRVALASPRLLADNIPGETPGPSEKGINPESDVAYLRVPALDAGKAAAIREKLLFFDRQGLRKLVLDLRDSASGEISEAVATARLFLASGNVTTLRGQTVARQDLAADPSKVVWKHPMTVLISSGTSGPAEVLAAAIAGPSLATRRGELVGERTFGSASEQRLIELEDEGALILTVANYFAPDGKSIPDDGVAPTVPVEERDAFALLSDEPPPPAAKPDLPILPGDDRVLKKALEILLSPVGAEAKSAARKAA